MASSKVDYSKKAMLVSLNISRWGASKRDPEVTGKVLNENGAQDGSGQFTKQLIDLQAFSKINTAVNAAKAYHKQVTLPWDNKGRRVLSSALFMEYRAKMTEFESQFETATREFVNNYAAYVEAAKLKMNNLYKWDDYPTIDALPDKFAMNVTVAPVPSGDNLHLEIADEFLKEQQEYIEQQVREKMHVAHKDIYERLIKTTKHLGRSLEDGKSFKSATIDNIVEICELIPGLTIEDDNNIKDIAVSVKAAMTKFPREDIIGNQHVNRKTRKAVEDSIKQIEDGMSAFFGA